MLDALQRLLDFDGCTNLQFSRTDGLGRVGVAGFLTGLVFGVHLSIAGCCLAINGLVLSRLVSRQQEMADRRGVGREFSADRAVESWGCVLGSQSKLAFVTGIGKCYQVTRMRTAVQAVQLLNQASSLSS